MPKSIVLLAVVSAFAFDGGLPMPNAKVLSGSDWSGIRGEYERHRQAAFPVDGGHRARNYGQQWVTCFDGRGFDVTPDASGWSWGLELQSYGFPGQERVVKSARAIADVEKLSYRWDSTMTEWFVNGSSGLEHGFTLASSPGNSTSKLALHMAVRGNLTPRISPDGRRISFLDAHGATVLNYAGLKVTDAQGHELTARFQPEGTGLRLEVEERGARYPIKIDPIAQQAYLKPAAAGSTQAGDNFGFAVAVSGDTVVVGARYENSSSTGINSTPNELSGGFAGAAYVFTRSVGGWSQQAYLKPDLAGPGGQGGNNFGWSVAISGDTVVVGAIYEDSDSTGINGARNEQGTNSGAAYVFTRSAGTWSQQAYLKPAAVGTSQVGDEFGSSVAVSGDTVVVGAHNEASSTTGINSTANESAAGSGAAYVFARSAGVWSQQAYLKPAAVGASQVNDHFGASVAVSGDTVVVGAPDEDSSALGVNGTPNELANNSGSAYVFIRNTGTWSQQAYLKPAVVGNTQSGDAFGTSVAVSGDTVAVGAYHEASSSLGINSTPNELSGTAGAAYVFTRIAGAWSQQAYLKPAAVGTDQLGDFFGWSIALSGDTLVVGAIKEASSTTGINSTPNESAVDAGAAYVFTRSAGVWSQLAYLKPAAIGTSQLYDQFGWSVAVSGATVVVGAIQEDSSTLGVNTTPNEASSDSGAAYVFTVPVAGLDLNADGKSDILWQQPATGDLWVWFMNGTNATGTASIGGPTTWRVPAAADFNGDGRPDILWQNPATGELWVWFMNGTAQIGAAPLGGGTTWRVVGTGDFNGDGKPDVLWQEPNSGDLWVWFMNGTIQTGAAPLGGATTWKVVGTADLNGDSKPDILWQNPSTGDLWVWYMNVTSTTGAAALSGASTWRVVGTGDFNGDGKPDILWQQPSSGDLWTWFMNGATQTGAAALGGATSWKAIGAR
jgi:hypothetical protein